MKKHTKAILITVICVIIFIGLFVAYLLSGRVKLNPVGTIGSAAGNANNTGLFCEYNGTVYFSNPYDGGALYSMTPEETNIKKLNSSNAIHINAGGSYLYYFQKGASGSGGLGYMRSPYGIYRTDLKGKNTFCLFQGIVRNLQLVDNYLYYLTAGEKEMEFYKHKIDNSDRTILSSEEINPACAIDGTIYYNGTKSNHYLYRMDTAANSVSTVWEGNLWYPVIDNGYVYYLDVSDNYRLSRYSLADNIVEKLTSHRVDCFNIGSGYIYYQKNSAKTPALMKMNLDGSQAELVAEGNYTNINMTSRYVYFQAFGMEENMYRVPLGGIETAGFDAAKQAVLNAK